MTFRSSRAWSMKVKNFLRDFASQGWIVWTAITLFSSRSLTFSVSYKNLILSELTNQIFLHFPTHWKRFDLPSNINFDFPNRSDIVRSFRLNLSKVRRNRYIWRQSACLNDCLWLMNAYDQQNIKKNFHFCKNSTSIDDIINKVLELTVAIKKNS